MDKTLLASIAIVAAALTVASCNSDKEDSESGYAQQSPPLTYEDSGTVVSTARVDRIDYGSRLITLRDRSGYTNTFVVGPQVQRLDEVKVGDSVSVTYTVSLDAELRPPTADEAANPILVTESTGRAPRDSRPAGSVNRKVRVVTTVDAVDLGNMLVTLRGPMGDTMTVRARKSENIRKLSVGDTIVVNYTETAAVSLIKSWE